MHELVNAAEGMLVLSPSAAKTKKELEFAFFLAAEAFREKANLSPKLANEAMLFLACETNFASAVRKIGAKSVRDFVLVREKGIPLARLKKKLMLVEIKRLALPEWGKKKGGYREGELAAERMATARIRN